MKTTSFLALTMITALGFATASAWADDLVCNTTFNPGGVASWIDGTNWFPVLSGPPDDTQVACIEGIGTIATIDQGESGEAKAIWIKSGAAVHMQGETGRTPPKNSKLTLHDDVHSQIDGELVMFAQPQLIIDGNVTIEGTGKIILAPEFIGNHPLIQDAGTNSELTLIGAQTGAWDDQVDTLVLTGGGTIEVKLNNRAHVTSRNVEAVFGGGTTVFGTDEPGLIMEKAARGDGFWIADFNPDFTTFTDEPILVFEDTVTGAGNFVVTGAFDSEIRIDADSMTLTGDVTMFQGKLILNGSFDTTGNLLVDPGSAATCQIVVAAGESAIFD